ncbi:MAG: TIM-barrel domain-containing protein [Anaerolineae bacterium]
MTTSFEEILSYLRRIGVGPISQAAVYPVRKALVEARWPEPDRPRRGLNLWYAWRRRFRHAFPVWPGRWYGLGDVKSLEVMPRGASVQTTHGTLDLTLFAPDLVRVCYRPLTGAAPEPVPYAIARPLEAWPSVDFELTETDDAFFLSTGALNVGILREGSRVFFADTEGRLLRTDVDVAWGGGGAVCHRTVLREGEHLFGLGERATPGNRRGRTHHLWNLDPAGYEAGGDPINLNIPVYVGLVPPTDSALVASYLVFYENPYYAEFDLGNRVSNVAQHHFAGGELRYYFAAGPVPELLERYTQLTGCHDLPPLWMLGYQQSRWSYVPEARIRKLARDLHEHQIPCDVIHLDIDYMDGFRVFTWDEEVLDLPQLAADLREEDIKLVTIIDPGVKKDPDYELYREGCENDYFCTLPDGRVFHGPVWPGLCAFPDFTSPRTRRWWGEWYGKLLDAGIAGFWNDMNEPAIFAERGDPTLPGTVRHVLEGRGGDHREAHNLYGMQMVRAVREGLLRHRPHERPALITRSGWAGVQRYSVSWTADNQSSWDSLRITVPQVIGLGLSGLAFTGPDVGGFEGEATGALFTRWLQMAAFMPFFRAHTAAHTPDQEPWSYGEPYLTINRRFIQLRYELLPYLYTAIWQMSQYGWPLVRPLWWGAQQNIDLWKVDDAFLCGDALLVAPVVTPGATRREVLLPPGAWYDFWTNRIYEGGTSLEVVAPLEIMPLFIRAGSVLPLGEIGPTVERRPDKFLRLDVYPLTRDGTALSWLYEDRGAGMAYREGERRISRFVLQRTGKGLEITWVKEGDFHPPYEHIALTLHGLERVPQEIRVDGEVFAPALTDPVRRTVLLGVPPFDRLEVEL